jgi:hypothetical protein
MGSHSQTTGWPAFFTARDVGQVPLDRVGAEPGIERQAAGVAVRVQVPDGALQIMGIALAADLAREAQ